MNNSKKLLALLMALAMLVTFAVPTFAAGETPVEEKLTITFEYDGYVPESKDVSVTGQRDTNNDEYNRSGAITKAVIKKGSTDFAARFNTVPGYNMQVTVFIGSTSQVFNFSTNRGGRYQIVDSNLYFWRGNSNDYLEFKTDSYGSSINNDLNFKVEYKKKPKKKLEIVPGMNASKPLPPIASDSKSTGRLGIYEQGEEVVLTFPKKDDYFVYSTIINKGNQRTTLVNGSRNPGKSMTERITMDDNMIVIVRYLPNDTDTNEYYVVPLNEISGAEFNTQFFVGDTIDPQNFKFKVKDEFGSQEFTIPELAKLGLEYELQLSKADGEYEAITSARRLTADDNGKTLRLYDNTNNKEVEAKVITVSKPEHTVTFEPKTAFEDINGTKGVVDTNKYQEGEITFKVVRNDAVKEVKVNDTTITANEEGVYKFDLEKDTTVTAEYKPEYKVEYDAEKVTLKTNANGVTDKSKFVEGTEITFEVKNNEILKKLTVGNTEVKKKDDNSYTHTVDADTTIVVEYLPEYAVTVTEKLDGEKVTESKIVWKDDTKVEKVYEGRGFSFGLNLSEDEKENIRVEVKVDGKELTDDNGQYKVENVQAATSIEVNYYTQVSLTVTQGEGGIEIKEPAGKTVNDKFDKNTTVKFKETPVTGKVIETVKVGETELQATDGVYSILLDGDKEVALKYKEDPVAAKKQELEDKVEKSKVLDNTKKAELKKAIEEAADLDALKPVEKQVNEAIKAAEEKAAAEKALQDKKDALNKKIDESGIEDTDVINDLKDKVKAATADTIDEVEKTVKEEIAKELQAQKDRADLEASKTELKKQIADSKLDNETKKALTDKVDEVTKAEDLGPIRDELAAEVKKAEEKAKAEKELQEAKDKAVKEIEDLENLDKNEKDAAKEDVKKAENADQVAKALDNAKKKDDENKAAKEAAEKLAQAKKDAKTDLGKLTDLTPEQKEAAEKAIDEAKNTDEVNNAVNTAKAQDTANKEKKAVEDAKAEAEKAQEEADEKAKEAEEAKKAAEAAQAEADEKAKEAEEAKKAAEDAKKAADEAKEKAKADPNNEDLKKAADEAAEKAEESQAAAETAKAAAEDAKAKADQAKADAEEAKDAADKAQEEADKAKADAEAKENALAPTAEEKDKAKKAIDDLDNLSPAEKNKFKDDVDKAQTKGEVEAAVEAARAKDAENKNKQPEPQPEPDQPGKDEPGDEPNPEPYYPPYYPGYYYDEPYVPHTRDYSKKDDYKPAERNEEKKEENKDTKGDILRVLYFYLDKGFYEMEVNGEIQQIPMDVQPMAINQRTMLPIRFVAEAIGATVEWHQDTQSATFTKNGITATITLGSNIIQVSDGRQIVLDAEPAVVDQRIFVPLTNISQIFGLTNGDLRDGADNDIEWDQENYRVIITVRENQ